MDAEARRRRATAFVHDAVVARNVGAAARRRPWPGVLRLAAYRGRRQPGVSRSTAAQRLVISDATASWGWRRLYVSGMAAALRLGDGGATASRGRRCHGVSGLAAVRRLEVGSSKDGSEDDAGAGRHQRRNATAQERGRGAGDMGARRGGDGTG